MTIAANGRPPFRADHIGSLLRPQKLRQAFREHAQGKLDDAAFRAAQDEAIREVVRLQEDCGLEVATDGEFRRISYWEKFVRLTRGLAVKEAVFRFRDEHGHESDFTAPYVEGKVSRGEPIALDEFEFVKRIARGTPKITMPAPSTMHVYRFTDFADPRAYRDPAEFFADLGKVYQAEIAALARAGCRYVQLDEVALALLCAPAASHRFVSCRRRRAWCSAWCARRCRSSSRSTNCSAAPKRPRGTWMPRASRSARGAALRAPSAAIP
jgi:5-methyltetrahydropteroyltriglutamate--homocysteine methyltransferase